MYSSQSVVHYNSDFSGLSGGGDRKSQFQTVKFEKGTVLYPLVLICSSLEGTLYCHSESLTYKYNTFYLHILNSL